MLRKLFIRVWIGPLPDWYEQWLENTATLKPYGFDFLVENDYESFRERCKAKLGVDINVTPGTRKAGDFDPALGVLFEEELKGYDFWGHTGLDVAFGRLDRFVSDEFLSGLDIFGNDPNAINGCFSLYRNCDVVNNLFREQRDWTEIFEDPGHYGFDEIHFTEVVLRAADEGRIRFGSAFWQSHDTQPGHKLVPRLSIKSDGTLLDMVTGKETMMFHFHKYRRWPISS